MISILLPAYKSEKLLNQVFWPSFCDSIKNYNDLEVIFYDNGGNGNWSFVDVETSNNGIVTILGNGENIGLNAALNACAKAAKGDYFYLCHTDMWLLSGWDTALLNAAKNLAPTSYLFCSRSIEPGYSHIKSQIIKNYGNEVENFQKDKLLAEYSQYLEKKIVVNARMPFFLHRKLWERIGGVDAKLFSYATDDDLIQQCYDARVRKFYMVYDSMVYHLSGKSNNQQKVDKDANWPYEYFINKWKSKYPDIHHPGQYHPKLIPFEAVVK
jgi:GT2 family glycosyltransferase